MKQRLLQYLACPSCAGELRLAAVPVVTGHNDQEILKGELVCAATPMHVECQQRYPIVNGVPCFVELRDIARDKAATAENFGWQWQHFTQQDALYAEQFQGWIAPVEPAFFKDKIIVEGGCGKGRHTRLAAEWGARDVIGVDLSDAVFSAYAATRELENAHIIQADIYNLPLRPIFDYAFSVGVLHHLPDPRAGFIKLAAKVRAGGYLSAWVYGAENNEWITQWVSPLRTHVTSRLSRPALLHLSKIPTLLLYLATKLIYGPLNGSQSGARLASHLFYNEYLKGFAKFGWREQHTIVFDHLVAPTAYYIPRREFEEWWRAIKACDVRTGPHNNNSWRGLGRVGGS